MRHIMIGMVHNNHAILASEEQLYHSNELLDFKIYEHPNYSFFHNVN